MRYLLVVDHYTSSILDGLKKHASEQGVAYGLVVLTRHPEELVDVHDDEVSIEVIECTFEDPAAIKSALEPFYNDLVAVICRGDKQVQFLRRLIPHLPPSVPVSSVGSLEIATNKRLMRESFAASYPEITPKFVKIQKDSEESLQRVLDSVPFPVIVKPANLVSSLLIQSCRHEQELRDALRKTFSLIAGIYSREERTDNPEVIVEEYLEGDFYSIDAYILEVGKVYFCPPVAYLPAQNIGVDDFFLYKRFVPTNLSADETNAANETTKKAVTAAGLSYSSAHVELIYTREGWKVIEIGPRLGRFRSTMYGQAYDINHSYNDIAIHLNLKPKIPNELKKYCSAYSIYPHEEGTLKSLEGLESLTTNPNVYAMKIMGKPGDKAMFAKNGGKAFAEFIIASESKDDYEALVGYIEGRVKAVVGVEK